LTHKAEGLVGLLITPKQKKRSSATTTMHYYVERKPLAARIPSITIVKEFIATRKKAFQKNKLLHNLIY
jgi:hypothetical protein